VKLNEKVVGLCYHGSDGEDLDMVKEAGFNWLRMGVPFPWEDSMYGKLSPQYLNARNLIEKCAAKGFKIMVTTPGLGAYRYDHNLKKTIWIDSWPDFVGVKGTDKFYENVMKTCAWYAQDLEGLVGPLWCNMNEIDIETFHGDYPVEVAAETAFWSAKGVVSVDPEALCGINLSRCYDEGLRVADMAYKAGHCFGYIGDDQYFGSWQRYDVERWTYVIDVLHKRYNLPVLACEWGYSSGGQVKAKPSEDVEIPSGLNSVCYVFGWHHEVEGGHTEEVQAKYIYRGLEIFAKNPHVLGSFLFCWKDAKYCYHCGREQCPSECFWGIVDSNLNPKPAYYAVQKAVKDFYKLDKSN